jgi:hemolysin activation/secretion protein
MSKSNVFCQLLILGRKNKEIQFHNPFFHLFFIIIIPNILISLPIQAQEVNLLKKSINSDSLRLADRPTSSLFISTPNAHLFPVKLKVNQNSSDDSTNNSSIVKQVPESITVSKFQIIGNTIFSQQQLNKVTAPFINRPLSFDELFQARSAITKLYTERGYVNSGAYIPPQELQNGIVTIQVLEGELEEIDITGTNRLNPNYIRSRLIKGAKKPVNVDSLLQALQLLRLNPLIKSVSAELSAGIRPGTSHLDVEIKEADPFTLFTQLDNSRSPSVGTNRRSFGFTHENLLGLGDRINASYTNTDGSDGFDLSYAVPVNALDGKVSFVFGTNSNNVIEEPFNPLDIESESRYYELGFRQPLILKPGKEFALGIRFSRQESETSLLGTPFALSLGADEEGHTRISAVRFFQEWVNRNEKQVFAARSQFSVGLDLFNATINKDTPDSTFFAWQGQTQWVRRLDEDFLLVLRGNLQLSSGALVSLEQFRLGGIDSVRGYRQDLLLGDNGLFTSAEIRIPIIRFSSIDAVVQLTPFFDLGTVWNSDELKIDNEILSSIGFGLNFSPSGLLRDRFSARLDWGIPLINLNNENNSLQENGVYFSINYNFF